MTSYTSKLLGQTFQYYMSNDRTVVLRNFKALRQTEAELHSKKLDVFTRPFLQIRSRVCMHVCICVCMYMCVSVCARICTYILVHTV